MLELGALRVPVMSAMSFFFAVVLLAGAALPIDRYRAYAERHDRPFDERRQRGRRVAAAAMGAVALVVGVVVSVV